MSSEIPIHYSMIIGVAINALLLGCCTQEYLFECKWTEVP